jgi:rubrerythrin
MTAQNETMNILYLCADIEGVLAEIYEIFTSAYSHNPDISRLFKKTAAEERNHEYQLRLAIKTCSSLIREINLTVEEAGKHLSFARTTLQRVKETLPTIEEALKMAINCETIFSQFHLDTAARFSDESCTRLFKAMMATDEGHTEALVAALAELKINPDSGT